MIRVAESAMLAAAESERAGYAPCVPGRFQLPMDLRGNPGGIIGMGMGLAVVKELVQLHNGRIWVESVPGEGSVFYVVLPLTQEY